MLIQATSKGRRLSPEPELLVPVEAGKDHTRKHFLCRLFKALDTNSIPATACSILGTSCQEKLSSDLDIAVHPEDKGKLPLVFRCLDANGYKLVQVFNYFINAFYFVLCWREGTEVIWIAVDIIFEHRRGGLIISSGEALVAWTLQKAYVLEPNPPSEFRYLVSKKLWKGMCSDRQAARIHSLAETLGRSAAQCVVSELLVGRSKTDVLDGCIFGDLTAKLAEAKNRTWITSFVRSPLQLACYLLSDAIRRIQRWRTPTGLLVVVVGPDGTGKSTLIRHLVQATGPAFRRSRVFHWRPMLLWRRRVSRDTTRPHCNPLHGASWSVVRLLAYLVDYWLGYSTLVRPSIARSGLVVFDRYFDDMWIDPKRYRYGGPVWLVKALRRFIPKADVTLVLDADEDTFLLASRNYRELS